MTSGRPESEVTHRITLVGPSMRVVAVRRSLRDRGCVVEGGHLLRAEDDQARLTVLAADMDLVVRIASEFGYRPETGVVTTGYAGTTTTRSASYNTNIVRGTLTTTAVAVCGLGNLGHVGQFKVRARVYPVIATGTTTDLQVRLSWKEGDGPLRSNDYVSCPGGTAAWSDIDLGYVTIPEKTNGTQRWTGQIEAYSSTGGDTLDVDYVLLIPTGEGYGKARAPFRFQTSTTFAVRDEFDQTAGNLNGKTLPVGGTWATSGADATDIAVEATGHTAQRATAGDVSGKYAIAGSTTFTDVAARLDFKMSANTTWGLNLIGRYVDANNYLYVRLQNVPSSGLTQVVAWKFISGSSHALSSNADPPLVSLPVGGWYSFYLFASAAGVFGAAVAPRGSTSGDWTVLGSDSALATGGTLASGKVGFQDAYTGGAALTRNYDNFAVWVPTADAVAFSGRSAEIRSDAVERADSTGTYWGPVSSYRGAHLYLPQAGSANRPSRILVKARRNDVDDMADDHVADATTVSVDVRPRYYAVPR